MLLALPRPVYKSRSDRRPRRAPDRQAYPHQLQVSAIHIDEAVPLAPVTVKSTKFPAATATFPFSVQDPPGATVQTSEVFAILPGVPCRSVTVIVFDCREKTLNCVAEQPAGTHVSTESVSLAAELALFTE
jgi:hypothetical protein